MQSAIFIGFAGVLIALEPSSATLNAPALISVFGTFCFAFMMLSGRALRGTPDKVLVFWQSVGAGKYITFAPITLQNRYDCACHQGKAFHLMLFSM